MFYTYSDDKNIFFLANASLLCHRVYREAVKILQLSEKMIFKASRSPRKYGMNNLKHRMTGMHDDSALHKVVFRYFSKE